MLKRVALIGYGESAPPAETASDIEYVRLNPGDPVFPGLSAVLADPGAWAEAEGRVMAFAGCMEEMLLLLGTAIDAREQFHPGSSARMCAHAGRFAEALGLSAADRSRLERASVVRDIGKLRIPNDVLLKKSVLSYDEWILLQSHAHLGQEIVREVSWLSDTEEIVGKHHECFDGTGYPEGLEGEGIPLLARAMKILDVYCAMTAPRFYRPGYSTHEDAVSYICGEGGKHFDPDLAQVFANADVGQPIPVSVG